MQLDTLIVGGGAAGLWLLDELSRSGYSALLLEAGNLGGGQTVASQGILHGGFKYTLGGLLTRSASSIREMPTVWRESLQGSRDPDLTGTRIRAEACYLWRSDSVSSRLGMVAAQVGLRVVPRSVSDTERPEVLASCPGKVALLEEQVISPVSLLSCLAAPHQNRILRIDAEAGLAFEVDPSGWVRRVRVTNPLTGDVLELSPKQVVFTAGAGNAVLRKQIGRTETVMQRRALHMVMLRGQLPRLNGHCVDGATTRATITSDVDSSGRTVWQVGGQIAERGVKMNELAIIEWARTELESVLPSLDLSQAEWGAYRVDRAERITATGRRPDTAQIVREQNVVTAWPTKLVLAPQLAEKIASIVRREGRGSASEVSLPSDWPRPNIAPPPWETCPRWYDSLEISSERRKAA
jgi:glycerol-3-phosphate dehydrogenase